MPFGAARPILEKMAVSEPGGPSATMRPADWEWWARKSDSEIRHRLIAGEEDSLTNLLRFGVTFTNEYRIEDEYLLQYGKSTLVNAFADQRADDLIRALGAPNRNQGFEEMRAFVEARGFSLKSSASRKKLKAYLLANLARMQNDMIQAREHKIGNSNVAFQDRGISLDSNLWPDYDLDRTFGELLKKGFLKSGEVRRVAIIGPGLDFVNKQEGVDYYPPQTTQPFAVLDSLQRLQLSDASVIQIFALDISPRVNVHINMARKNASLGKPYTLQLPWYAAGRWNDEFRAEFTEYWRNLGLHIGDPLAPIPVPKQSPGFQTKAISVVPAMVNRISTVDMNIVFQRLRLPPEERLDLIIGTNIFIYYGSLEQSLARANIAAMLKPGGFLLSNQQLDGTVLSGLEQVLTIEIPMTDQPVITDHIYCYRHLP